MFTQDRDVWVSGIFKSNSINNAKQLVENYSFELERLSNIIDPKERIAQVNKDESFIGWTTGLFQKFAKERV